VQINRIRIENFRCIREPDLLIRPPCLSERTTLAKRRSWRPYGSDYRGDGDVVPALENTTSIALKRVPIRIRRRPFGFSCTLKNHRRPWDPDMVAAFDDLVVLNVCRPRADRAPVACSSAAWKSR
jgi:hypothetical protein